VWSYGVVDPASARRQLAVHRTLHELRLARFEDAAREHAPAEVSHLDPREFGEQLTVQAGIHLERSLLAWCETADEWLRAREDATPPGASPEERSA